MSADDAYRTKLNLTYEAELELLRRRFDTAAKIVNTGGGCMGIEAIVGTAPDSDHHRLQLLVTTVDNGLATDRGDILHWYACLYDADDGGEALADGHDLESFETACDLALTNLRNHIPPSEDLCSCLLVPGLDY
ncbi:hypothetical protein C5E51_26210 [Nocardia nova]|uniref:hypothetical protein n=1 Tax=Nocardia nova TaxID=37330 RepID=UPI000CEA34DF|nr:hypothetical protein [Nocardia nova]PPJ04098.1 hypothetical protein C5E51_26210 [Nocardia nova]